MLYLMLNSKSLTDVNNYYPFTINGTSGTSIYLSQLEFFVYNNINNNIGVSISFGSKPTVNNLNNYGICLDLLPIGSPSNYKIANVNIPSVNIVPTKIVSNRYVSNSRSTKGILGQFCLDNNTLLSCGTLDYLGEPRQLECGYNYEYEEIILDNFYYGLSSPLFTIPLVGSCMLKNTAQYQMCDNALLGCSGSFVCLPILDPNTNIMNNYCVAPFRSQVCEENVCPDGYTCSINDVLPYCLSNSGNLAITNNDCYISQNLPTNGFNIFIYVLELDKYVKINLDTTTNNYISNMDLNNSVIKLSNVYQTVTNYPELGITNGKARLPGRIMVFDNSSNNILFINLVNQRYVYERIININTYSGIISDVLLDDNDNLFIVRKNTISSLREYAYLIDNTTINFTDIGINVNFNAIVNDNWLSNSMFRENTFYDCYLYSPNYPQYNKIGTATIILSNNNGKDLFNFGTTSTFIVPLPNDIEWYIVFNSNKFAINNQAYNNSPNPPSNSYTTNDPNNNIVLIPTNFRTETFTVTGENSLVTPIIFRNNQSVLNPIFVAGYTPIDNGDRILIENEFSIYNVNNLFDNNEWNSIDINNNTYLYIEKIQQNYYYNNAGKVDYDNYIYYLHTDFLSSEGSVPIFNINGVSSQVYNQNFNYVAGVSSVNFTVYDDMINYTLDYINLNDLDNEDNISLNDIPSFIGVSSDNASFLPIVNGLNKSISYNFEASANVKFSLYSNNYLLINSVVQGKTKPHNYVQKIEYSFSDDDGVFNLYGVSDYDYFYQSSYTNGSNTTFTKNLRFKYSSQIIAPNAKKFYFDVNPNVNNINTIEENLFDPQDNTFSFFTTFKNNEFIKENLDSNSNNIYSNKAPPIGAYSRYNNFSYSNVDDGSIGFNYDGLNFLNSESLNHIEMGNSIKPIYDPNYNCINTYDNRGINYITIRDPAIIDIFLSNPSSEIVLQKNGTCLENYYISSNDTGISTIITSAIETAEIINNNDGTKYNPNNWGANSSSAITELSLYYTNNNFKNKLQNTFIEINRSVIAIEEYDIYINQNGDTVEYMILKLNCDLNITDVYTTDIINFDSNWKLWTKNFVPLTYLSDVDIYAYTTSNNIEINNYSNISSEYITILDSSILWGACKNLDFTLPLNFSNTSYNKMVFSNGTCFNTYNIHDQYFYKKKDDFIDLVDTKINTINFSYIDSVEEIYNTTNSYIESIVNYNSYAQLAFGPDDINITQTYINSAELLYADNNYPLPGFTLGYIFPIKSYLPFNVNLPDDASGQDEIFNYIDYTKSLPKKISLFNINVKTTAFFMRPPKINPYIVNSTFKDISANYINNSFICFKKKHYDLNVFANTVNLITNSTALDSNTVNFSILNFLGNNHSSEIYGAIPLEYQNYFNQSDLNFPFPINLSNINTQTNYNSFNNQNFPYINNNNINSTLEIGNNSGSGGGVKYIYGEVQNKLFMYFIFNNEGEITPDTPSLTNYYNFIAQLNIRPINSGSIAVPDSYQKYDKPLYMINNLFLSTLPKQINTWQYINLNILDDHIISNLFYTNYFSNTTQTNYKGLGLIQFNINACPIFSNYFTNINEFNLVNYEEIQFPSWFSERYISRFDSIPQIINIFTSLKQGNIFNNLNYYAYINYTTADSNIVNNQFIYLSTDVDINTVLENRGIPFTRSLSEGEITNQLLTNIVAFEPYNKYLYVLGKTCGN
jgi:hypothetical protein